MQRVPDRYVWSIVVIVCFICFGSFSAYAAGPYFSWAIGVGGTSWGDAGLAVTSDASGNVYVGGTFNETVDFDPGPATEELTSAGGTDIFVAKYSASGEYVWAKRFGDSGTNGATDIAVDSFGNVFFTCDAGSFTIAKLDSDGNTLWSKSLPGDSTALAVDASNNPVIGGRFSGNVDFDPGPGVYMLDGGTYNDGFVCELSADGHFSWAVNFSGYSTVEDIDVDDSGNVLVTGTFEEATDFNPEAGEYSLTPNGSEDCFIVKLNASGGFTWARGFGGVGSDEGIAIGTDTSLNVYITGTFEGTVDFDPGTGTTQLTSAGGYDAFVSKFNNSGTFSWAKQLGGTSYDYAYSLGVDSAGNVYTSGNFWYQSSADFDPGPDQHILAGTQYDDVYISKLDSSGNYVWAGSIEGESTDYGGYGLHVDSSNNVYVTGQFNTSVDADPTSGEEVLTSNGTEDMYLTKLTATSPLSNFNWILYTPVRISTQQ